MSDPDTPSVGLRVLTATYGTAFFSLSQTSLSAVIVPLWAVEIGASPLWIGVAIGARAVLPLILTIQGGLLMDRLGPRRGLMWLAVLLIVVAPLNPLLPFVAALVLLQLVAGLVYTVSWVGAQTQINRISSGSQTVTGRFTFFSSAGSFIAPLAAGAAWHATGAWGGFGLLTLWGVGLFCAAFALPRDGRAPDSRVSEGGAARVGPPTFRMRDLLPRIDDYVAAYRLGRDPAVAFPVLATAIRGAIYAMRQSFYPVYMTLIALNGSQIGILIASAGLISGPTALFIGPVARRVNPGRLIVLTLALMIVAIAATPAVDSFGGLAVLAVLFGISTGFNLPLLISDLSRSVPRESQGVAAALRASVGLVASVTIPVIMGAVVEWAGLEASFWIMGAGFLVALAATSLMIAAYRRHLDAIEARNS